MDSDLVEQFEGFYEDSKTPVFRAVLLARGGDRHVAEDAVADAYEKAYLRWHKLVHHPNPTAWVIRTAINHRISTWRRQRNEPIQGGRVRAAEDEQPLDPRLMGLIRELPPGSGRRGERLPPSAEGMAGNLDRGASTRLGATPSAISTQPLNCSYSTRASPSPHAAPPTDSISSEKRSSSRPP